MTISPVFDLIERGKVVTTLLTFLVGDQLFDLAGPVDNDGFKTLNLILFTSSCLNIVELLRNRNIELGSSMPLVTGLSKCAHESVQVGSKLLLNRIGPVVFSEKLGAVLSDHLAKKIIKRVSIDHASHNDFGHVVNCDLLT